MQDFIAKLQAKDERTKWRIAVAASVVAMVIVIAIWLMYFDSLFRQNQAAAKEIRTDEFSFWQSMKKSAALAIGNIKGLFTRQYDLRPE